jgi:hypothetical protein
MSLRGVGSEKGNILSKRSQISLTSEVKDVLGELQSLTGRRIDNSLQTFIDDTFTTYTDVENNLSQTLTTYSPQFGQSLALAVRQTDAGENEVIENIKETNLKTIEALNKIVNLITEYNKANSRRLQLEMKEDILNDPVLLTRYIEEHYNNVNVLRLSETHQIDTTGSLQPQYVEYIAEYGYPEGGIFDLDRLSNIMSRLIGSGVLSASDYTLSSDTTQAETT